LFALKALDKTGRPTERGRKLAALGLDTRLAALVLAGQEQGLLLLAVGCAALLSDRDPSGLQDEADFTLRLDELAAVINEKADVALTGRYHHARREFRHLLEQTGQAVQLKNQVAFASPQAGALLLTVYPDRLAGFVSPGLFQLASGRMLRVKGRLANAPFIVAPEAEAGSATGSAYLAVAVQLPEIQQALAHLITEQEEFTWQQYKCTARRISTLGRLILSSHTVPKPASATVQAAFCRQVRTKGLAWLPWSAASESWLQRVRYAERAGCLPELPDFSEAGLLTDLEEWLVPYLHTDTNNVLDEKRLLVALQARLPYGLKRVFDEQVPESFTSPAGSRHPIHYDEKDAYVEVRIQELFGLTASPLACRRPLVFRLLSPARRPLQITRDLAGFWKNTYPEIRTQMKIRYPRHYWPEDPFAAQPTTKAKPR
jgi:ATP-dependent helicase HrpB